MATAVPAPALPSATATLFEPMTRVLLSKCGGSSRSTLMRATSGSATNAPSVRSSASMAIDAMVRKRRTAEGFCPAILSSTAVCAPPMACRCCSSSVLVSVPSGLKGLGNFKRTITRALPSLRAASMVSLLMRPVLIASSSVCTGAAYGGSSALVCARAGSAPASGGGVVADCMNGSADKTRAASTACALSDAAAALLPDSAP